MYIILYCIGGCAGCIDPCSQASGVAGIPRKGSSAFRLRRGKLLTQGFEVFGWLVRKAEEYVRGHVLSETDLYYVH
jgi:hypothetical protein